MSSLWAARLSVTLYAVTVTRIPRNEPCTTCGRPVTRLRIFSDATTGPGRGDLSADHAVHVGREVLGDRVDHECNYGTR